MRKLKNFVYALVLICFYYSEILYAQQCNFSIPASTPYNHFDLKTPALALDKNTGLMWLRCSEGQYWAGSGCVGSEAFYSWSESLQHVKKINETEGIAGYHDWRVPNIKEMLSLVEDQCYYPAFNMGIFPGVSGDFGYWSSSPVAWGGGGGKAWFLDTTSGMNEIHSMLDMGNLRLVRTMTE